MGGGEREQWSGRQEIRRVFLVRIVGEPLELLHSFSVLHCEVRVSSLLSEQYDPEQMVTKKIEGRMEAVEEQLVGFHGDMAVVKGDLQHLGPLEIKVDSMLEKLSVLERLEEMV